MNAKLGVLGFQREPFAGFGQIWRTFRDGIWALLAPVILQVLQGILGG